TFEPVDNRRKSLSAFGTLSRGLRHFVTDPGTSLDEAFAVARSEAEQRTTATALEAFHQTFNFCLSCRQYTCSDCWNAVEGRCLSCAPTPDAAPPETRHDTMIRIAPVDLAQPSARVPTGAMTADPGASNGVPAETGPTDSVPADALGADARPADALPPELEPIDVAVAKAEAAAKAESAATA